MKKFLSDVLINCDLTVSGSTSLGAATGVTVATSDNSNKIATTAWVKGLGFSTANTTYLLDVPANTTNFRLLGSDSSTDTITLSAAGASSITRVSASELRITSTNSVDYISNVTFANDVITFTGVGEGFNGTINLSTYLTQAEGDARYLESYSETDTLDTVTSRDGVTTNTIGVGTVNIIGTTAGQELLTVDGTNGRLFTVTDDLSDSLFSVNTIAGLPVIEVFSDNTIKLGNFANPIEIDSSANIVIPGTITASGYNDANWNTAYNDRITSAAVSGTSTKTLTLTQGDGGTVTASWTDIEGSGADGYVSSVAITNNALDFTGVGSGFAGSIDLLDIAPIQSVAGNGTTISTSYDGDTGQVVVTPIFNTTIAETGTGLVTSSTIWNYINDSILDIAPIQTVAGDGVSISTSIDTDTGQVNIGPIVNNEPTQNSNALVKSGGIWSYIDGLVYDNYQSWNLKTNNVQRTTVGSGGTLDIVAGSNVSVAYGAGGVVTISSTDSNTDTNNYVTGLSFNTGNGVLTATRQGLADLTVDLDGRYLTSFTETTTELSLSSNILSYRDEVGAVTELDLSLYLDDTNLARLTSGTLNSSTGIATFSRDDSSTFTVDFSALFDDVDNYVDSVAFSTTNGILTIGRTGSLANLTVDLDGRYDLAGTAAAEAGVVNTRIDEEILPAIDGKADSSHLHDDRYLQLSGGNLSGALNVLYDDHVNGAGWDKNLFIGTSDDLGLVGAFPTYVPSGSYGFFSHAASDGVFIGSVPTEAGSSNYYATIAWGDDATEYLQFLYKGSKKAHLTTEGHFYINGNLYANGGNSTEWNTAYTWGNHDGLYAPLSHTHSATDITSGTLASARLSGTYNINATGYSNRLLARDNRIISPSEDTASQLRFGFTSFTNDNSGPWADFLHLRSYQDSSGGRDNLLMFSKSDIEIRLWQQDFNSTENYSEFRDVAFKDELEKPAILSNGSTPSLNTGISAAEVRTLIGAGTSSTDTNFYLNGASFNTGNGVLTLSMLGTPDETVDLDGRYLTSFTESDPVFIASPAGGITSENIGLWDEAYGWGDHSTGGYLTSVPNTLRQGTTLLDTAIEYYDENSGGDLSWAVGADDRGGAGVPGQNAFVFRYNRGVRFGDTSWRGEGTEVLTLDDSGNVGILTPQAQITERLNVNGNIKSTGYLIIGGDDAVRIALGSGTGNAVPQEIASFGSSVHIGAFIDFTIYNETKEHMRSGTLQLVFNADEVMFNEVSTMDIGDTTPCLLTAVNNSGVVSVLFESPDTSFYIKYQTRTI